MDSRNSIIYGSLFPNHAKKDLKKAIGRNHSPVWWESPERGGCGRRRRRGTADRNGAPGPGQGQARWGAGHLDLGDGGGSGGAGQPIPVKGAGAAQEGDTGRGRAERFHGTSFLKERRGHGRGIPFYEGGNRRGRKAGGRAKGAPLSSGEAGGGKGGAARKHCILWRGARFGAAVPAGAGPCAGWLSTRGFLLRI